MSEANDYPLSPVTEIVTAPSIRTAQKDGAYNWQAREFQAGDAIDALARYYINHWNAKALPTALRERRLAISDYRHFITTMYPLVVGFNGGLIQSIKKIKELQHSVRARELVREMLQIDHVRNSNQVKQLAAELRIVARDERLATLRALAGQLKEEQEHNDLYRKMLEVQGIDHEAYYTAFEIYLYGIPVGERDHLTHEVLSALRDAHTPDAFPDTAFSQPVLANASCY